ncbi:hypothetical protein ASG19_13900 [Rhizobium sp. Leaf306]|uniref:hypothetical protein n=1 Tax=Rhizobium sp. Leaf306 TaxID=1736330 RepID=UPI0007144DE0|nr:hypothetical protein [Rhizobium sp. Leaf306]KQQ34856.1 hypothetical protein ASG19_13900 [Rhizobium sp. Leaf306]
MKLLLAAFGVSALFVSSAFALEPIPGSVTYGGQPVHRLQKAPVGSTFDETFYSGGERYTETYMIQPDRSLVITGRVQIGSDR